MKNLNKLLLILASTLPLCDPALAQSAPPTIIERVIQVRPDTQMQMVEGGRVLQSIEIAPGRYRVFIRIKPEPTIRRSERME